MSESIQEAFDRFERAAKQARVDGDRKKEMARCLEAPFELSGKTKKEFGRHPSAPNRATIDRWLAGVSVPHPSQLKLLREFLMVPKSVCGTYSLATVLLSQQIRPVIVFLLEEEKAGRKITEDELDSLIWIAERSKGVITSEIIHIFLGRE